MLYFLKIKCPDSNAIWAVTFYSRSGDVISFIAYFLMVVSAMFLTVCVACSVR